MDRKTKKIRLCLVLPAPHGGGAQKVMLQLANNFSRDKFEISLILFSSLGDLADLIPCDISVFDLRARLPATDKIIFNPFAFLKLCFLFRKLKPDVIFCALTGANLIVLLAKILSALESRVIIRETTILTLRLSFPSWQNKLKKSFCRILYPHANKIVAPTQSALKDLDTFIHLKQERQVVIPNFIDSNLAERKLSQSVDLKDFHLRCDKPVIISVGRFDHVKGIDIGIRAFKEVLEYQSCYYWILGHGIEKTALKKIAKDLCVSESVSFLGFQSNPYIFLQKATIFLLPSRYEAFPNALLEAMYCQLPCVISRYNDSVGEFIQDGLNGIIAEPENPTAMANAIKKLLANPTLRQEMGTNAKARINNLDIHHIVGQFEHLFTNP